MSRNEAGRSGRLTSALVLALALVVGLGLMEGVLRLALNPSDFLQASLVEDPVLGVRIAPGTTGHDALGFRNARVPDKARVVAIGDSHTYGVSAPRDGSWPAQLAVRLGEPVYNLGVGGFGPLQYLHVARTTARELRPEVIVVGLYFGNDLVDASYVAHGRPHWHSWRRSPTPPAPPVDQPAAEPPKRFAALRDWLARHSMLYSVTRTAVAGAMARGSAGAPPPPGSPAAGDARWAWQDPAAAGVRTVFRPAGRLQAVDADRPAVAEGMEITAQAFAEIARAAEAQRARLLVVMIPTKERAYCSYLRASGATLPAAHARLCDVETAAKARMAAALAQRGIEHVDATPALEAGIAAHTQLYPPDDDGHEIAAGYGAIAGVVAAALARPAPAR